MFYVHNVQEWLSEVITACNESHLDPEDSIFLVTLFSSLDFSHVEFFRDRKKQLSSYSGNNVHIFSPIIYDDVVPDNEWHHLRNDFNAAGIKIGSDASVVVFRLRTPETGRCLEPVFLTAHTLPESVPLPRLMRAIVDSCLRYRQNEPRLVAELAQITHCPNLVSQRRIPHFAFDIQRALDTPRLFLSHASGDKPFVRRIGEALRKRRINPWLDEHELTVGDSLRPMIEQALRRADALLLFLSHHVEVSYWVQHEAAFFSGAKANQTARIIPVIVDDVGRKLASQLPVTQGILRLDFRNEANWDKNIQKLVDAATKSLIA